MKNLFLFIASLFICVLSSAQRRPPAQALQEEPMPIDSLPCMVDSVVYCVNNAGICEPEGYGILFYGTRGNLIGEGISDTGLFYYRLVYEYDTNENIISCTQLNPNGSWIEQDIYSDFTAYGDPVYSMEIMFGNNNVADTLRHKYAYIYNENGQILEIANWVDTVVPITDTAGWSGVGSATFSYTADGKMDTMVVYGGVNQSDISLGWRVIYTYGENGYAVTELAQNVGNHINLTYGIDSVIVWVTAHYAVHYYYPRTDGECATSGISALQKDAVKIYPNPFTDKLTIEPAISYRLFDILGQEMDKNNWGTLPVGTYILSTEKGSVRVVKGE